MSVLQFEILNSHGFLDFRNPMDFRLPSMKFVEVSPLITCLALL